jgi:dephospho-CoA kinase
VLKVAVTGGAGAGKTVACDCFRRLGAHVVSLDELAREAVKSDTPVLEAITDHFGKGILRANGSLDRRKLRGIITRDGRARKVLESLTHPEIFRLLEEKTAAIKSRHKDAIVVVEIPLLMELGLQDQFDVVVLVEASSDLQKSRLMARDGSSSTDAQGLLGIQVAAEKKRPYADYIVKNEGPLKEMEVAVRKIYRKILKGI